MGANLRPSNLIVGSVAATATKLLSPSPDRRTILVSACTHDVYISDRPDVSIGYGIKIPYQSDPVEICACHFGDFVTRDLWAIADGGATRVSVLEGFMPIEWER